METKIIKPRVIGLIGCPGSGKTTYSRTFDPNAWVTITLDDYRETLWPPTRRTYWDVREGPMGRSAHKLLHRAQQETLRAALELGWNVVLADTHIRLPTFQGELDIIHSFGIEVEWKFFETPWAVLEARNLTRPLDQRIPDEAVRIGAYRDLYAPDAWWRSLPADQIEIIEHKGS